MNKISNPIEFLIDFAWASGADLFTVNNAKDELKKLKENSNNNYDNVAWARLNKRGDLYDPRFCCNPHIDKDTIVPLYTNKEEFKTFLDRLKKA